MRASNGATTVHDATLFDQQRGMVAEHGLPRASVTSPEFTLPVLTYQAKREAAGICLRPNLPRTFERFGPLKNRYHEAFPSP
jgi:hypothetical protein